jgi:hypothetical protein
MLRQVILGILVAGSPLPLSAQREPIEPITRVTVRRAAFIWDSVSLDTTGSASYVGKVNSSRPGFWRAKFHRETAESLLQAVTSFVCKPRVTIIELADTLTPPKNDCPMLVCEAACMYLAFESDGVTYWWYASVQAGGEDLNRYLVGLLSRPEWRPEGP